MSHIATAPAATGPDGNRPSIKVRCRRATAADIPTLARIEVLASTPPFEHSTWAEILDPIGVPLLPFLEAMFHSNASAWGGVEDFVLLEDGEGAVVAGCAVYTPHPDARDRRVLDLCRLPQLAASLGWSRSLQDAFLERYEAVWGPGDAIFLQPQAPAIVETVAVLPGYRGLGLGDRLMRAAKTAARDAGHGALGIMAILGNEPAHRLYQRHFQPWATFHAGCFDDQFPGVVKYRCVL